MVGRKKSFCQQERRNKKLLVKVERSLNAKFLDCPCVIGRPANVENFNSNGLQCLDERCVPIGPHILSMFCDWQKNDSGLVKQIKCILGGLEESLTARGVTVQLP